MKETLGKEFYESADKVVIISRPETFEDYLQRLKDRRTEDDYKYTDEDFKNHIYYILDCYEKDLSVYKCLEFMYFAEKEILPEQIWNKEKMEGIKQLIQDHKKETLEEAAERLFPNKMEEYDIFLIGAKWQQEFNDTSKVNRVEVIQHSEPYNGRAYTNYDAKEVEIQFQDRGKTLKIFLK